MKYLIVLLLIVLVLLIGTFHGKEVEMIDKKDIELDQEMKEKVIVKKMLIRI